MGDFVKGLFPIKEHKVPCDSSSFHEFVYSSGHIDCFGGALALSESVLRAPQLLFELGLQSRNLRRDDGYDKNDL